MRRTFVILSILLCVVLAAGCSPQERVARIVKKYNLPTVTEYVTDTVIMPERVRTDTVVMRGDPVVINDSIFITEFVPINDTTFIVTTKIKADTIVRKVPVEKYVVQEKVTKVNKFFEIFLFLEVVACLIFLAVMISKMLKK